MIVFDHICVQSTPEALQEKATDRRRDRHDAICIGRVGSSESPKLMEEWMEKTRKKAF